MNLAYLLLKDFFFAFLSALLGTILGILWARWKYRNDSKTQKEELKKRLIQSFNFNITEINKCIDFLTTKNTVPDFKLDTASINHILFSGRDLFKNSEIFKRFNWERYQLEHLNSKIDHINTVNFLIYFNPINVSNYNIGKSLVLPLHNSLVLHLKKTKKDILKLIEDFENTDW